MNSVFVSTPIFHWVIKVEFSKAIKMGHMQFEKGNCECIHWHSSPCTPKNFRESITEHIPEKMNQPNSEISPLNLQ